MLRSDCLFPFPLQLFSIHPLMQVSITAVEATINRICRLNNDLIPLLGSRLATTTKTKTRNIVWRGLDSTNSFLHLDFISGRKFWIFTYDFNAKLVGVANKTLMLGSRSKDGGKCCLLHSLSLLPEKMKSHSSIQAPWGSQICFEVWSSCNFGCNQCISFVVPCHDVTNCLIKKLRHGQWRRAPYLMMNVCCLNMWCSPMMCWL